MGVNQTGRFATWIGRRPIALSVILGVVGVLLIVVGVLGIRSSSADSAKLAELRAGGGTTVQGTLVDIITVVNKTAPGLPKQTSFCPKYAYTASDGVQRTIVDRNNCVSVKSQLAGKTVTILVDTQDPSTAFIDDPGSSAGRASFAIFAWSMLALGGGLVVAAPIVFVRELRRRRSTATG